jgi:hypothetical protein
MPVFMFDGNEDYDGGTDIDLLGGIEDAVLANALGGRIVSQVFVDPDLNYARAYITQTSAEAGVIRSLDFVVDGTRC